MTQTNLPNVVVYPNGYDRYPIVLERLVGFMTDKQKQHLKKLLERNDEQR